MTTGTAFSADEQIRRIRRQAREGCTMSQEWLKLLDRPAAEVLQIWNLWNGFDPIGEAAHAELNRRGLGALCAV